MESVFTWKRRMFIFFPFLLQNPIHMEHRNCAVFQLEANWWENCPLQLQACTNLICKICIILIVQMNFKLQARSEFDEKTNNAGRIEAHELVQEKEQGILSKVYWLRRITWVLEYLLVHIAISMALLALDIFCEAAYCVDIIEEIQFVLTDRYLCVEDSIVYYVLLCVFFQNIRYS